MLKKLIFVLCVSFFSTVGVFAQSTCACSVGNGGCTASQSCPAGKIAECSCSASGCSSSCVNEPPILDFAEPGFEKAINSRDPKTLQNFFASTIGKNVEFVPASTFSPTRSKFLYKSAKGGIASHWDALEFLARNGELKINGQDLKFWTDMRDSFMKGGELQICTSRADVALAQIAFLSGKKFSVTSGDSRSVLKETVKGNGLDAMIASLSKAANIEIATR